MRKSFVRTWFLKLWKVHGHVGSEVGVNVEGQELLFVRGEGVGLVVDPEVER